MNIFINKSKLPHKVRLVEWNRSGMIEFTFMTAHMLIYVIVSKLLYGFMFCFESQSSQQQIFNYFFYTGWNPGIIVWEDIL